VGHEFPVDAVEDCFEVVPFPGVLAVEQIDEGGTKPEGGREGGREGTKEGKTENVG